MYYLFVCDLRHNGSFKNYFPRKIDVFPFYGIIYYINIFIIIFYVKCL